MSFVTAVLTDASVPRGSDKDLNALILDDDGSVFDLTEYDVFLRLASSWTYRHTLIDKAGFTVDAPEGKCQFKFAPEDTENLMAMAYDANIRVVHKDTGKSWPAFSGRIGITPTLPEEVAE